ncbi:fungal-specific transcription factor domain-containing protein [Aspergillus egyptiacus]|nr:fungal-specific transcription factor domain-containing protein [Aspergillus egyptiacus]
MDPMRTLTAQKRPREKASPQQPRKRARQSCETCKARKTKCIGIDTGTCQYCAQLGVPCEVNLKTRKRPFYRISEEVYESSIALLRRFVSEEELPELTVDGIQAVLARLGNESGSVGGTSTSSRSPKSLGHEQQQQQPQPTNSHNDSSHSNTNNDAPSARSLSAEEDQIMEPDEHPALQEELGCMVLDSLGKYRYVGADSSIRWNHAARLAQQASLNADPKVIPPLKTGLLPPKTPESLNGAARGGGGEVYLPPRQACMRYVGNFFQEVHCLYWFYSPEQFYNLLETTVEERGVRSSASWLCSLYSIFAVGSMVPETGEAGGARMVEGDVKQAADYLALAKSLSGEVSDEADTESVKAFGLLSLAMHAMCYSVGAYLHLGTAVRIGFSLGLHRNVSPRTGNSVERERGRRLWWTIYTLDHEMAIRFGYPCAIGDEAGFVKTPLASEQIMDPGPNTPLGYQALSVSLVQLRKKISHNCFVEPAQVGGRLPMSRVFDSLTSLRSWLDDSPAYLSWDSPQPPQHRRPVSILHLRYCSSVIFVTRPFLLFTVSRPSAIRDAAKAQFYEELSGKCIEAAERAVGILRRMVTDGTLSSRILFDCHCIGETMWILILAVQKFGRAEHQAMLRFCLETVRGMEKIGWCEKVAPELEARVHESGALEERSGQGLNQGSRVAGSGELQQGVSLSTAVRAGDGVGGEMVLPEPGAGYLDITDFNFDISEFDVLETLDLDSRSGLMEMLADPTLAASQLGF